MKKVSSIKNVLLNEDKNVDIVIASSSKRQSLNVSNERENVSKLYPSPSFLISHVAEDSDDRVAWNGEHSIERRNLDKN